MKAISSMQELARQGRWGRRLLEKFIPLVEKDIHLGKSSRKHSLTELRSQLLHYSTPPPSARISLPSRGNFRSLTNKLMAEVSTRKDFDKRHIVASFAFKETIEEVLNSLADADEQAEYLATVGHDPDNYHGDIHKAARQWQMDCYNNPDNLFKGARGPNRAKGARHEAFDLPPEAHSKEMWLSGNLSDVLGTGTHRDHDLRREAKKLTARLMALGILKKPSEH